MPSSSAYRKKQDAVEQLNSRLRVEIDERLRAEASLLHQVYHDAMTGLPNRRMLRDRLQRAIHRAASH